MKYVWMLILGIVWMWWTVEMILDVWYNYKRFKRPFEANETYTEIWFVVHGALVFLISLFLWLMDKGLIGG